MLEGEANIFFENTFIGKTVLDARYVSDTLDISLGRDKGVSVNRIRVKDYSSKKFIGTRKEESVGYEISVKNNKPSTINMVLMDQIPVSRLGEISVDLIQLSGGNLNSNTGSIQWEFILEPNHTKQFSLVYSVKYPRNQNLTVE